MRILGTAILLYSSFLSCSDVVASGAAFCGSSPIYSERAGPSAGIIQQPNFLSIHGGRRSRVGNDVVCRASSSTSEAERLLQMAKRLREQAAKAEQDVHDRLITKKVEQDSQIDRLIQDLFVDSTSLVDQLRCKQLCIDTLENIVDRLDERQVVAEGKEYVVEATSHHQHHDDSIYFERVSSQRNEFEIQKLQNQIDDLIAAVQVLDDEFLKTKADKGETYVTHTEEQHWGGGKCAQRLTNRIHELQRERQEHFLKREEDLRNAQRIKSDRSPPPKAKDDHGWIP